MLWSEEKPLTLFPAYAGVILWFLDNSILARPFPRLRGGDPLSKSEMLDKWRFSPPTRG